MDRVGWLGKNNSSVSPCSFLLISILSNTYLVDSFSSPLKTFTKPLMDIDKLIKKFSLRVINDPIEYNLVYSQNKFPKEWIVN